MDAAPARSAGPPASDHAPRCPSPTEFTDSPLSRAMRQPVLPGLFLPTQAGGWSSTTLPRSTTWTFDYNKALTLQAEALGSDLIFGLSQWLPNGGYGDVLNGQALDSVVTLTALTSVTSRILLYLHHPCALWAMAPAASGQVRGDA